MGLDNPLHIAFLVLILLLVFGARRLPELGRSLGTGMREFKHAITGESAEPQQPQKPALTAAQQQEPQAPAQVPVAEPAQAQTVPTQPSPAEPQHHG